MRLFMIAGAAGLLLLPAAAPTSACEEAALEQSAQVAAQHVITPAPSVDLSAATKKPKMKKKKEKIEYMRAAPM